MDLYAFLHPEQTEITKEVVISERFKDKDGNVVPFKIRPITQKENDEVIKRSYKTVRNSGGTSKELDIITYKRRMVLAGTVYPDFSRTELCEAYGTLDPIDVIGKMLYAGEFARLANEISKLSGFADEAVIEEAKN